MGWMSLSDILYLYRARLGARAVLVQECLAVLGIAVGVALLFASQVASTSLTHSVQQLTRQVVGDTQLQLEARGPNGFREELLAEIRRVPGVRRALPVLEQQADVVGPQGQRSIDLIGADPHFARLGGSLLRRFSAAQLAGQRAIALPSPIAQAIGAIPLQTVKLEVGASVEQVLLGTTLGEADIGGLVNSPVALAPLAYAQRLTGLEGRVSRIFVKVAPGSEARVRRALGRLAAGAGANLEPADFDSTLFAVAVDPQNKSETLFSAISALVGFMFALNAMLVTVPARRKLIEDIRPAGATGAMTVQVLLFDAAVLGVLACLLGLALGDVLSVAVFRTSPGYLSAAFPVGSDRIVTWRSVLLAIGAGCAAAGLGVVWPVRDVLRRPYGRWEQVESKGHSWASVQAVIGLVFLTATTGILIGAPQEALAGCVTLVLALICLLPGLFDLVVAGFECLQSRFNGASIVLAITELRAPPMRIRSLAIAATAAIAVFGTVAVGGAQTDLQHGLDAAAHETAASADIWVIPDGRSNSLLTVPFMAVDLRELAHIPGVSGIGLFRSGFLDWGKRRVAIKGQPASTSLPIPASQMISGDLATAVARLRRGGWAVLSEGLASEHHLHIGQAFTLPAPRSLRLRVAALITNLGWSPGAVILKSSDYARAWASSDPSAYEITVDTGASSMKVSRLVQRSLGYHTALVAETRREREQRFYTLEAQGFSRLAQIRVLLLIAAVLAVAGAMGAMIWQRRNLIAFIKCQGFQRGVLWRWLLTESGVIFAAGCLIGAVFGLYGQLLISHALSSVTGFPVVSGVELMVALTSFAFVSCAAVAVIALPGYLVVRVPPQTVSPAY